MDAKTENDLLQRLEEISSADIDTFFSGLQDDYKLQKQLEMSAPFSKRLELIFSMKRCYSVLQENIDSFSDVSKLLMVVLLSAAYHQIPGSCYNSNHLLFKGSQLKRLIQNYLKRWGCDEALSKNKMELEALFIKKHTLLKKKFEKRKLGQCVKNMRELGFFTQPPAAGRVLEEAFLSLSSC